MTGRPGSSPLDEIFTHSPDTDAVLLELRDVGVRFGGITALSGVTMSVRPTEIVAIIGPNGAGKSTTLNAISGLVKASGVTTFDGHRTSGMRAADIAATGIGRSFQDAPLIDGYSVLQNVLCGAHPDLGYRLVEQVLRRSKVRRREELFERRARVLLDFVGLGAEADTPAGSLSYGARKRVDLARAMVRGPKLLLLDEPSSGLDSDERAALQAILAALRAEARVAVLYVEHHMDLVRATATRVIALKAGELLLDGDPSTVLDSSDFATAVLGTAVTDDEPNQLAEHRTGAGER